MKKEEAENFDVETIVAELGSILRKDSNLKSFDIIPQPHCLNTSPVLHVDHNLGLESWCVKDVYCYVREQLLFSTETLSQINYLAILLLLNPNVKTYWNARKKLVLNGELNVYAELDFVAVVLSHKPKIQDLYNHRKWLLSTIFQNDDISSECFLNELQIVQKAAFQHTNNHTAWNFASWLLVHIKNVFILQTFWKISKKWISTNVSDFSGMHFHQRVLIEVMKFSNKINEEFKNEIVSSSVKYLENIFYCCENLSEKSQVNMFFPIHLIATDLELNENLINFYGNHESLWNHRRFLSYLLVRKLPEEISEENMKIFLHTINERTTGNIARNFLQKIDERFFVNVTKSECEQSACRYKHWMTHLMIYPANI